MTMEQPEVAPDLVGRTSARLLAAGIDRRDRLEALHLLAILDASIDTSGRVRRPLDDLAAEFELPPMSVMRSLDHLEQVGAVQRDGGGVVILGTGSTGDAGLGGLQLADFLDDVRASCDQDVPLRRRSTLLARSGAALAAAAAAVAIFTLAPGPSTIDQPLALGDRAVSTTIEPDAVDAESELDPPITTIRPSTTIVAPPAVTAPVDTTVVAAATPDERCVPTSSVADRVDCIVDDGLVADGGEGVPQDGPIAPEATPPAAEELAPQVDAPATPTAPASTVVDVEPAVDSTKAVVRLFRS